MFKIAAQPAPRVIETMKSWFIRSGGGIDSLERVDIQIPETGPGEVLVRMTAATLNFHDVAVAKTLANENMGMSHLVPLSSATGEVVAVGDGVTRVKPGNRVNPIFGQGWFVGSRPTALDRVLGDNAHGVAREFAVFDAHDLVHVPAELSDLEAATLSVSGLTAWSALFGERFVTPGDWMLVQGTGGVSIAALQWAKAVGVKAVVTSSSDAKLQRAKTLGADVTVNYRTTPDWAAEVREQVGHGMDLVIHNADMDELEHSLGLLNERGMVAVVGMFDGGTGLDRRKVERRRIVPVVVGHRSLHEDMIAFAVKHRIHPVIDKVFSFDQLPTAYRVLESGQFFGKIGITYS